MHSTWKLTAAGLVFGYFGACAPVKFEKAPPAPCGGNGVVCVQKCDDNSCTENYTVKRKVGNALVDILIVNDNSGSMSFEQTKMADRFPTFLQSLGSLDYKLAMITTDISTRLSDDKTTRVTAIRSSADDKAANGYGAYQDGRFIPFASGVKFLTPTTPSKESLFYNTIRRNETINCENSGYVASQCPSTDERGVFAANLALDNMASEGFARPLAHLAVIILSDEDERGISDPRSVSSSTEFANIQKKYPLESQDLPENFVQKFRSKFPDKTLSVHSIIVRPGDSSCLSSQASQGNFVRGVEGFTYDALSRMTGGTIGTICASDYGAQLTNIGYSIQNQVTSLPFNCRPTNDEFDVQFDPQPAQDIDVQADFQKMQLKILDTLPPMTTVTLNYECTKPY